MFAPILDEATKFSDLVSVELFQTLGNNINALLSGMQVGSIVPIMVGLPGVPTPDPNTWQLCDGSEILHPLSPLRSVGTSHNFTPNYADLGRYLKCFTIVGDIGTYSGENNKDLSHNHGGITGTFSPPTEADRDSDHWTTLDHHHSISTDLGTYNFEPPHIRVLHYIKIN